MLDLSRCTLVIVGTLGHAVTKVAIDDIMSKAKFGEVLIFTDAPERIPVEGARYIAVPVWDNKKDAGRFYYSEAANHVTTEFGLYIEWDGGIYDATKWRPDFYDYDYIGAPWNTTDDLKVGNGGFTLMSTRFAQFVAANRDQFPVCTDWELCRGQRGNIERARPDFRWAPYDVAHDFAWELARTRSPNTFGYHGIFNWPEMLGPVETLRRALMMAEDDYLMMKLTPLLNKARWLSEAIGARQPPAKLFRSPPQVGSHVTLSQQRALLHAMRQGLKA